MSLYHQQKHDDSYRLLNICFKYYAAAVAELLQ